MFFFPVNDSWSVPYFFSILTLTYGFQVSFESLPNGVPFFKLELQQKQNNQENLMSFVAVAIVLGIVLGHLSNKSRLLIGLNCILYLNDNSNC